MGMPVTLEVADAAAAEDLFDAVYAYFDYVDRKFSTCKLDSVISLLNRHELALEEASEDMKTVFTLAEEMRRLTHGFFDIRRGDTLDPSGLVKGWAIFNAAELVRQRGFKNYYVEAGGDFQVVGKNDLGQNWRIGIRSPYNSQEIVKVVEISDGGIATSGTYVRGAHIYNPNHGDKPVTDILSLTVIGPDIFTADCFATAAFAMGKQGIHFIEHLEGFEGYMIDNDRQATFTSGFSRYVCHA